MRRFVAGKTLTAKAITALDDTNGTAISGATQDPKKGNFASCGKLSGRKDAAFSLPATV